MSGKKKKAPIYDMEAKRKIKKPYYERYWWVPLVISGLSLFIIFGKIILLTIL